MRQGLAWHLPAWPGGAGSRPAGAMTSPIGLTHKTALFSISATPEFPLVARPPGDDGCPFRVASPVGAELNITASCAFSPGSIPRDRCPRSEINSGARSCPRVRVGQARPRRPVAPSTGPAGKRAWEGGEGGEEWGGRAGGRLAARRMAARDCHGRTNGASGSIPQVLASIRMNEELVN